MDKKSVQEFKKYIRWVAMAFMILVVAFGFYYNRNSEKAKEHVQELSTEVKGQMVLHTEPDLTIEEGSMINLDFSGTLNGEDVGSGDKVDVTVGGGKLNEEFENQLLGHHPGDQFTIEVPMSKRLTVKKKYRGKIATVDVTINGIYVVE